MSDKLRVARGSRGRGASRPTPPVARPVLPRPLRLPLAVLAGMAAVVLCVLAVYYHGATGPGAVDRWIITTPGERLLAPSPAGTVATAISSGGGPIVAAVLVCALALLCLLLRRRRLAVLAILGPAAAVTVTELLKPLVGRTIHGAALAFPSGHTTLFAALGLVVALLLVDMLGPGRSAAVALVVGIGLLAGVAMASSLVALGYHYPTDTVGGLCSAFAVVPAVAGLVERWCRGAAFRAGATRSR